MLSGPLLPRMIAYAIPIILQGFLQQLYNAADMIVVGRLCGPQSLAAVGSTSSLVFLTVNLLVGLSVGSRVLIAKDYGAGDKESVSRASHTAIFIALVFGAALGLIALILSPYLLLLMDSPKDIIGLSTTYLRIYFLGTPAVMVMNFGTAILGAIGDTRRPTYIVAASGIINVALNVVLVLLGLDVAGVAIATIVSLYFSGSVILIMLMKTNEACKISFKKLKLHFDKFRKILAVGIPSGLQSCVFSLSNIFIQSTVNTFGSTVVAASAASANVESFAFVGMAGMSQASLTFTGQNLGAKNFERIPKIFRTAYFSQIVFMLSIGILYVFLSKDLIGLYNDNAAVVEIGSRLNLIKAPFLFLCGLGDVCSFSMRGLGKSVPPMIISMLCICGIRLIFAFGGTALGLITPEIPESIDYLYYSYSASWSLNALIQFIVYKKSTRAIMGRGNL